MKLLRFVSILVLLLAGGTVGTVSAGAAVATPSHHGGRQGRHSGGRHHGHHGAGGTYTCTGGDIPPGTYASVHVSGVCFAPTGTIVVRRDLTVEADALLDATTPGDPSAGNPQLPAAVTVGGDVRVGSGGVLLLGCSPYISCPTAVTHDQVGGSVEARDALGVVLHSVAVRGDVSIVGGGGGTSTCATIPPLWLADPALANGEGPGNPIPVYTDTEDVAIGGNLTVAGVQTCWLGSLRDEIGGSARFTHDALGDSGCDGDREQRGRGRPELRRQLAGRPVGRPPARAEHRRPVVGGASAPSASSCRARRPAGSPSTFGERVVAAGLPRLAHADVGDLDGRRDHGLGRHPLDGQLRRRPGRSGPDGLGAGAHARDDRAGRLLDVLRPGQRDDGVRRPQRDGDGPPHGTTSASGRTRGTFLVISGGTASGALGTLAGYGTFSSRGQPAGTLRLVEHLRIT